MCWYVSVVCMLLCECVVCMCWYVCVVCVCWYVSVVCVLVCECGVYALM